jgi:tetratricopeptide (TPR) repeat protein
MTSIRRMISLLLLGGAFCLPTQAHEGLQEQIEQLTQRIQRDPRSADLYVKRGELYRQLRQWTNAQSDYDRAQQLDPASSEIVFYRGRTWLEAGKPSNARTALDAYLKLKPDHIEALLNRARTLEQLRDFRASAADYSRAIALTQRPTPDQYIERSRVQVAGGAFQEALAGIDEGIGRLGSLVTLQSSAIEIELRLKRWDAALARLDRIAAQSPRKESYLEQRGQILKQAGRTQESRRAFAEALKAIEALPPQLRQTRAMVELERRTRAALL